MLFHAAHQRFEDQVSGLDDPRCVSGLVLRFRDTHGVDLEVLGHRLFRYLLQGPFQRLLEILGSMCANKFVSYFRVASIFAEEELRPSWASMSWGTCWRLRT